MPEFTLSRLTAETGWTREVIEGHLAAGAVQHEITRVGDLVVHLPALEALKLSVTSTVAAFHKKNPLVAGISKEELRDQVQASSEVFTAAMEMLVREKKLEASGEIVHLPGRGVVMKDEEAESKN